MPSYIFTSDITLHCAYSPGTYLLNHDDIYVVIKAFQQVRRSRLAAATFPIIFHDILGFEQVFYGSNSIYDLQERLEDYAVNIEFRQITDIYDGGTLLAYFDTNAREFFNPPSRACVRSCSQREFLMSRTIDFPGVPPRVEYSTNTLIKCMYTECFLPIKTNQSIPCYNRTEETMKSRVFTSGKTLKCGSKSQGLISTPNYYRPTVNTAIRCGLVNSKLDKCYADNEVDMNSINAQIYNQNKPKTVNFMRSFSNGDELSLGKRRSKSEIENWCYGSTSSKRYSRSMSMSTSDLRSRNIKEAQEHSDHYWNLYRYWQNELTRLQLM